MMLKGGFNRNAMQKNRHLTGILTTMSSTRELNPSILLTRERKTLSARECVRTVDGDDVEEYDEDEDKLESGEFNSHILQMSFPPTSGPHPPAAANAVRLHLGDCQYQSVEFYKAKKRLIGRYEEVSGGVKADISPDPLSPPQEMKKQKNNYKSWFAGHYPSPLQDGESYTGKMGVQLRSLLACTKTRLMVSLQTSNSFLGKCLTTLQTVPLVKFRF